MYVLRLAPEETGEWDKIAEYGDAGARAYELYVITDGHIITDVNHRVQQLPCSGRSFAPHGAPAWMFPDEAMFDIEWSDLASSAQREMIATLKAMVSG